LVFAVLFYGLSRLFDGEFIHRLNFLTRAETLLPLGALVAAALVGLVDDIFNVKKIGPKGGGLKIRHRLLIYTAIAIVGAYWFYYKLDWDLLHIPFLGDFNIGWWYIPIFIFVIVATSFSVNEIDGLDGLSGGTLLAAFAVYSVISFMQGKYDLAAFCGVIVGSLLAFLWFNIHPARFFMGDTGAMSLGTTLGIVAMLTNTAFLLPIIGLLFVIESLSVIIQITSKKFFHRKVFLSAPIHHHLEAIGWPETKIVMRFWVIAAVTSAIGLIIFLLDKS
jgi:phospho-N-acetylmuramoyl-pentapeptide-transferase